MKTIASILSSNFSLSVRWLEKSQLIGPHSFRASLCMSGREGTQRKTKEIRKESLWVMRNVNYILIV